MSTVLLSSAPGASAPSVAATRAAVIDRSARCVFILNPPRAGAEPRAPIQKRGPIARRALRAARVEARERPRPTRTPPARHRGTATRTSRAATAAKSALIRLSSMIALVAVTHFAAEHPVRQRRVGKNDWQDDHHTDQHENLA